MKFSSPLLKGTLIRRYRRALADVRVDNGEVLTVHVFNNGTMAGCCEQGNPVMLSDSQDPSRRNRYTWELIDMGGLWVGVNQHLSRRVLIEALAERQIDLLKGYRLDSQASSSGGASSSLILHSMNNNCYVSLQSVSWVEGGTALFPDSTAAPARSSLEKLRAMVKQGHRGVALFHVLRNDCSALRPAAEVDPEYCRLLSEAMEEGVEALAYRAVVNPTEVTLGDIIPVKN